MKDVLCYMPLLNKSLKNKRVLWYNFFFKPLLPDTSMHICKVLARRIGVTIKSFFSWLSFLLFYMSLMIDSGVILYGGIRC